MARTASARNTEAMTRAHVANATPAISRVGIAHKASSDGRQPKITATTVTSASERAASMTVAMTFPKTSP